MEKLDQICFTIISTANMAKSSYLDALSAIKMGQFATAKVKLKEGDNALREAHKTHMHIISQEASGFKIDFSLLLMHAEDQISTAEIIKILVEELCDFYPKS